MYFTSVNVLDIVLSEYDYMVLITCKKCGNGFDFPGAYGNVLVSKSRVPLARW
jgi:hypothetical protein